MHIKPKDYRVKEGQKVALHKWPTQVKPFYKSKDHYRELLDVHI